MSHTPSSPNGVAPLPLLSTQEALVQGYSSHLHEPHTLFTKWGGSTPSSLHSRSFGSGCIPPLKTREEGYTFCMKMSNLAPMKTCTSSGLYWWNQIQLLCHPKNKGYERNGT
ncbi:hypothetical protein S83_050764 [Arachis hypogaea]